MPVQSGTRVLVLGGIRSGKSRLAAELLVDAARVRYIATAAAPTDDDPHWARRLATYHGPRPENWTTEEIGAQPRRLADLLATAGREEALLVDDLGGWLTALLDQAGAWQGGDDDTVSAAADGLARAVRDCAAERLVLVSPEVGLSVVPATEAGRTFAAAIGTVNQALAQVCDDVVLVVAGQPGWLKGTQRSASTAAGAAGAQPATGTAPAPRPAEGTETESAAPAGPAGSGQRVPTGGNNSWGWFDVSHPAPAPRGAAPTTGVESAAGIESATDVERVAEVPLAGPAVAVRATNAAPPPVSHAGPPIEPGIALPMPDETAAEAALERLPMLDVPGLGFGPFSSLIAFVAGTQGSEIPRPWRSVRLLVVYGEHEGAQSTGEQPPEIRRRLDEARQGEGVLALLAGVAGADVEIVECATPAAPIETVDAMLEVEVDPALRYGWQLAESAVDRGADALCLAGCGPGAAAAAVAVISLITGAEAAGLIGRVPAPGGRVDDDAWIARCRTIRDALRRVRNRTRYPKAVLASLGGPDIAVATGVILGAAYRRTPVLLDGPVGSAAALVARDFGAQTRHWLLMPDHGGDPAAKYASDTLGTTPLLDLRLGLGEGAACLATLPLLRSMQLLAGELRLSRRARALVAGPATSEISTIPRSGSAPGRDSF
jgi:nicotinate-nucleotide--dimethylbenzimidazole phosphoribosyltransferase